MFVQILIHTPVWVWLMLAGLIALGLLQMRPRRLRPMQLLMLPAALMGLGLWSMAPVLQAQPVIGLLWLVALVLATALARGRPVRHATWLPASRQLQLPGSVVPLAVILAIFSLRYASGVGHALHPEWRALMAVQAPLALLFGGINGLLLGRTLGLLATCAPAPRTLAGHADTHAA